MFTRIEVDGFSAWAMSSCRSICRMYRTLAGW
jgi:hypothetical protein